MITSQNAQVRVQKSKPGNSGSSRAKARTQSGSFVRRSSAALPLYCGHLLVFPQVLSRALGRFFEVNQDISGVALGFHLGEDVLDPAVGADDEGGADDAHDFL